ncbi:MAG TPA: C39 family peptidase [Chloroflexota bacterium]|nr:C39 family peptidase [Chloroflexota bacterium]
MRNPVLIALTSGGSIPLRPAAIALAALALVPVGRVHARPLSQPALWTTLAPAMTPAAGWTLRGLAAGPDGRLHLAPSTAPLACASADIDGGIASYDPAAGLCAGRDPYAAGSYGGRNYYNGARFHYGTLLSPPMSAAPFDQAIASWVAATPPGTWLELHLRVRLETGGWTRWYDLPIWASGSDAVRRHSVAGQSGVATVATDTLVLHPGRTTTAYQLAATLFTEGAASPALRRLTLTTSRTATGVGDPPPPASAAWGNDLSVPGRSQMLASYRGSAYGGGGEVWCSPTTTSMILAYWAHMLGRADLNQSVPLVAGGAYDWTYRGTGNWPFNVAYATSFAGMDGYVARFTSLSALEPWIAARVPLALSIAFGAGELPGAPISWSAGHLIVLRGFDRHGNPIVDDPAAPTDATVRHVYPRAALERAWLAGSDGTTYVIFPQGWTVPVLQA